MIGTLIDLLVRLGLAIVTLTLRLAIAMASLVLRLLVLLIGMLWRSWRRRATARPHGDDGASFPSTAGLGDIRPRQARPASPSFTPRPLRRRPGR